ncbi:MAG: pilin [Patescibacteria group bacterium]|nr:pilin [Patescibacteria group bacterium]
MRHSSQALVRAAALTAALLAWSSPVLAAGNCCICSHPSLQSGKFCLQNVQTACESLNNSTNADVKASSCAKDVSANPCKKIPAGQCLSEPADEISFKLSSLPGYKEAKSPPAPKTLDFKLNIPIPGLTFFAPYTDASGETIVPMFAQYVQAFQALLIGLGMVAAAIMLVYGGWLYLLSGTGLKVQEGKKVIIDALIGLVLIFSATVILANMNPNTANFGALKLKNIQPQPFSILSGDQYSAAASLLGADRNMPTPAEMLNEVKKQAAKRGIDPCIAWAVLMAESGGKMIVGHDENWYAGRANVLPQSRVDLLRSRKYYSGKAFEADIPTMPSSCTSAQDECHRVASYRVQSTGKIVENDDAPQFGSPPDFGIDWRFSHGFGGGLTIFPNSPKCPNGWRGYTVNGRCFTVAELVTEQGQIDALLSSGAFWKGGKPGGDPVSDPMSVFKAWAGCQDSSSAGIPCSRVKNLLDIKQRHYDTCKAQSAKS